MSKLTSTEASKSLVTVVTECPHLFDLILTDFTSGQQDVQVTAVQMLTACLHSDALTRLSFVANLTPNYKTILRFLVRLS